MKRFTLLILLIANAFMLSAQKVPIKGTVVDESTGDFLPGANVYVQGTTNGTITDIDGNFSINASKGDTLIISFIGFVDKKIEVTGASVIEVSIKSTIAEVDEVIVIGYGYTKKSDLTGAVGSINEELMNQTTNSNLTEALQGRLAGVQVVSSEGAPGGGVEFKIRGASTINANSQPLYVIDGIPIEVDEVEFDSDGIPGAKDSPINDIDPANIESIEILKDASATAIYGSRGANGVVMITTKSGKTGSSVVNFSASTGFQTVPNHIDLLTGPEFAKFLYGKTGNNQYAFWETYKDSVNTNWQEEMFGTGVVQNYNIGLSGGNDATKYAVGAGYYDHKGIIGNKKGFNRYTANFKLAQDVGEKVNVNVKFQIGETVNNSVATGGGDTEKGAGNIRQIMRSPPTRGFDYDPEEIDDELSDYGELDNPKNFIDKAQRVKNSRRILSKVEIQYDILDNLKFTSRAGANLSNKDQLNFYPKDTGKGKNTGGYSKIGKSESIQLVSESFLNYNFNITNHKFNLMTAYTIEKGRSFKNESGAQDFALSTLGFNSIQTGAVYHQPESEAKSSALMSYLGRAQYNYNERYLLTASARLDGTSRFLKNKWAFFPSASAAWRVSEEYFFAPVKPVVSTLKLRLGYGATGNQKLPEYSSWSQMKPEFMYYTGDPASRVLGAAITNYGNPNLRWEYTYSYNAGIDMGAFEDRISASFDFYIKHTDHMLLELDLPVTTGYDKYWTNIGSMENKGVEISLNTTNIDTKDFRWTSNFNISFNRNKILDLGGENTYRPISSNNNMINNWARLIEGEPIGIWWGYETEGIYKDSVDRVDLLEFGSGEWRIVDQDKNDTIDNRDRTMIGRAEPLHFGGFVNSFKYKQFSLDVFLSWSYGGDIYNANRWDLMNMGEKNLNRFSQVLDAWVPEDIMRRTEDGTQEVAIPANPNSNRPRYGASNHDVMVDDYVEDGSYLRVKTITLSYKFNKRNIKKIGIKDLQLYTRIENLYTFTKYTGYDPEVDMQMGTKGLAPGIDYGAYPRARTFTFGLKVKL